VGFLVTDLLSAHFQDIMNVEYTAAMEKELDEIEQGRDNLLNTLGQFWKKFEVDLQKAEEQMENVKAREEATDEVCDKCGSPMVLKWGRFGRFLACTGYPECKNTRQMQGGDGEHAPELTEEAAGQTCPEHEQKLTLRKGRFGHFLACSLYPDNCKTTRKLVRNSDGTLGIEQLKPIDEQCPECGKAPLAWRRGRFGPFIACSTYPTCRYIKKKEAKEIGMACPTCSEGQVLERKGRWGRSFYGCNRFPKCDFTAHQKPVPEPCPQCGAAYLLEKETKKEGRMLVCAKEDCEYSRTAA